MAKGIVDDTTLSLDAVDFSVQISQSGLNVTRVIHDVTTMGGSSWVQNIYGLISATVSIAFFPDLALSTLMTNLWDEITTPGSTGMAFVIRQTSAAKSATNPEFNGTLLLPTFDAIPAVAIGDAFALTIDRTVTGAVIRDITP